ncbi:chaperone modulator CbpM [Klebsiella variicola]|uniref:chaperone modulator CbpM n=1 Tax=Klebsiella variicola TaxID=244366 RepID=UPI002B053168|nr:chaperone modulator CbpM [Klebsiella variicola]
MQTKHSATRGISRVAAFRLTRATGLRNELELDWPGIAVALTLLDENARLTRENRLLQQRLARFLAHG